MRTPYSFFGQDAPSFSYYSIVLRLFPDSELASGFSAAAGFSAGGQRSFRSFCLTLWQAGPAHIDSLCHMSTGLSSTHAIRDTGNAWVQQYLAHPDFRVVSAFFLGWVFFDSARRIMLSPFVCRLFQWCETLCRLSMQAICSTPSQADIEAYPSQQESHAHADKSALQASRHQLDEDAFVFILNICFLFSSIAQFGSLINFGPYNGAAGCTFVVAWGSMASQAARFVGLLMLSLELRRLHAKSWEIYAIWIGLVICLGAAFALNATSTGNTSVVPGLNFSICYRRLYLPTSLASPLACIVLEAYVIIRLISFKFMSSRPRHIWWATITDINIFRTASLLLLDLLIMIPPSIISSPLAEFIPFSIGALLVIALFNFAQRTRDDVGTGMLGTIACDSPFPAATPKDFFIPGDMDEQNATRPSGDRLPRPLVSKASSSFDAPTVTDDVLHITGAPRKILPSQTQAAEEYEKQMVSPGLAMRRPRERPHVFVVIHEDTPEGSSLQKIHTSKSIIGSDIIRTSRQNMPADTTLLSPKSLARTSYVSPSSAMSLFTPDTAPFTPRKRRRETLWSPDSTGQSSYIVPSPSDAAPRSILRDSTLSQRTYPAHSPASFSSEIHTSESDWRGSYNRVSAHADIVRVPSRPPPPFSLVSRTGDELPTVMERLSYGEYARHASRRSRRRTFGQQPSMRSRSSVQPPTTGSLPQLPPFPPFPDLEGSALTVGPPSAVTIPSVDGASARPVEVTSSEV